MEILIVIAFLAFIGWREWDHGKHIQDLETKLFVKDTKEYVQVKQADKKPETNGVNEEDDLVDPYDISPEEGLKSITPDTTSKKVNKGFNKFLKRKRG